MIQRKEMKSLEWRKLIAIVLIVFSTLFILNFSSLYETFDARVISPVEFRIRSSLGKAPQLDPRIRVFNFDDYTAHHLERDDLRIDEWATLIQAIDKKKPHSIFIDKIFALPIGSSYESPLSKEEADHFVTRIRSVNTPVIIGSSVAENPIRNRATMDPHRLNYRLSRLMNSGKDYDLSDLSWMKTKVRYIYGPNAKIEGAFERVGHFNHEGFGKVLPFIRIGNDIAVPHSTLLVADDVSLKDGRLRLNGHRVHLDHHDRIPVNFSNLTTYNSRAQNLLSLLIDINRGEGIDEINQGDVVVILPLMYTGNVDYKDTAIGRVQGGYINVALINSLLSGRWIQDLPWGMVLVGMAAIWGVLFANCFGIYFFWLIFFLSLGTIVTTGILGFVFFDLRHPWVLGASAMSLTSLFVYAWRIKAIIRETNSLKEALQDSLSSDQLQQILENPGLLKNEPTEEIVTIVFIDIVNFSLLTERLTPIETFNHLRRILRVVTDTIHQYGGIIDKTLGDGVLCFFGYRFDRREGRKNHADQALQAAVEIQNRIVSSFVHEESLSLPVIPLRIGINTAGVFIGDIGDRRRIDFTLIGRGVNFAQRLEVACEPFKILMGSGTKDLLSDADRRKNLIHKRHIQIKHKESMIEAHEYDPFIDDPSTLRLAREKYRKFVQPERRSVRWDVSHDVGIILQTEVGSFKIKDFSHEGLGIEANIFFAKGVLLRGSIKAPTARHNELLAQSGLMPIHCEVRWGQAVNDENIFRHGLAYIGLNKDQCDTIFKICNEVVFKIS